MGILDSFGSLFTDYTMRTVALGCAMLGIIAGALGSFAVLRRQSLMGDAVSHAALPGIVAAFLLTGSKSPLALMLGAALAGWLATLAVSSVVRTTRVKYDAALGIALSVFFGFGMVLLTYAQKSPDAAQAGLSKFLFGQAAAMVMTDVYTLGALGVVSLAAVALMWKEFKILCFDPDFAASSGFQVRRIDAMLTTLIVIAIVIGLQTVGVVLMSAMIVAPAAAARQWTDRLSSMVFSAAIFGAVAGISGALVSGSAARVPTGPAIVLSAVAIVAVSLMFAGNRGIIWNAFRNARNRRFVKLEAVLESILMLAENHETLDHPHEPAAVLAMARARGATANTISELESRRWICVDESGLICLTPGGIAEAKRFREAITQGGGAK